MIAAPQQTKRRLMDVRKSPEYWGRWFTPIWGRVKQTNLNIFFQLGAALQDLVDLHTGMPMGDILMKVQLPERWLHAFLEQTREMEIQESRDSAKRLLESLSKVCDVTALHKGLDFGRNLSNLELSEIWQYEAEFNAAFDREYRYLDVFTVTPIALYDTRRLLRDPEAKFSERVRSILPAQFIEDLKQAARCLAFEIPTGCAFHICRATESLILKYYEVLSGHGWTFAKRDWKIYIEQLGVTGAPRKITDRLDEIRQFDRNAYAHPETNVALEEAPVLFELCAGVVYQMADEISRKAQQQ
jgi:hypothetical protein